MKLVKPKKGTTIEALLTRIGLWGTLYYSYNKEPRKNGIGNYLGPGIAMETAGRIEDDKSATGDRAWKLKMVESRGFNLGALIIRIEFWGPIY